MNRASKHYLQYEMSKNTNNCQKIPTIVIYQQLSINTNNCPKIPTIAKKYQQLSGDPRKVGLVRKLTKKVKTI